MAMKNSISLYSRKSSQGTRLLFYVLIFLFAFLFTGSVLEELNIDTNFEFGPNGRRTRGLIILFTLVCVPILVFLARFEFSLVFDPSEKTLARVSRGIIWRRTRSFPLQDIDRFLFQCRISFGRTKWEVEILLKDGEVESLFSVWDRELTKHGIIEKIIKGTGIPCLKI